MCTWDGFAAVGLILLLTPTQEAAQCSTVTDGLAATPSAIKEGVWCTVALFTFPVS